jgi:hypothetical protein
MNALQTASDNLAAAKRSHKHWKSDEMPAETREYAECNYRGDRDVNGKEPLPGEPAREGAPITKRNVQNKHCCRNCPESHQIIPGNALMMENLDSAVNGKPESRSITK